MKPEDYLRALRAQLKGFSPREQDLLIEEISTHFDSGEDDPDLGTEIDLRRQKMLSEMGSPKQMGKGFRAIHRPGRLIDYLLILIPTLAVYILARFFINTQMLMEQYVTVRIAVYYSIFCVLMVAISFLRRSLYLKLYWILILGLWLAGLPVFIFGDHSQGIGFYTTTLLGSPNLGFYLPGSGLWAEWIVPSLIMILVLLLFVRMIWHVRHDPPTVAYACLLAFMGVWFFYQYTIEMSVSTVLTWFVNSYYLYAVRAGPLSVANLFFLSPGISFVSLGFFFLLDRRDLRWLALAFCFCAAGIQDTLSIRISVFWMYILITGVLFPLAIVLTAWLLEKRKKVQWQYDG